MGAYARAVALSSGMTPGGGPGKEAILPGRRVAWLARPAVAMGKDTGALGARGKGVGQSSGALVLRIQAPPAEHSWEPWIVLKSGSQRPIDGDLALGRCLASLCGFRTLAGSKGNDLFFLQLIINFLGCVSSSCSAQDLHCAQGIFHCDTQTF